MKTNFVNSSAKTRQKILPKHAKDRIVSDFETA
jgi:hypothetical protein